MTTLGHRKHKPAGEILGPADTSGRAEYERIMALLRSGDLVRDNHYAVVDIDGLLQFTQLDFIPFFYCSGSFIEDYLKDFE